MKSKIILIVSGLLIAALLCLIGARSKSSARGPVYQGRTAHQWLGEVFATNQSAAMQAFHQMGTNALPVLVREFETQDSGWDRFYRKRYQNLPVMVQRYLPRPAPLDRDRWEAAGFVALNLPHEPDEVHAMIRLMADDKNPARLFVTDAAHWLTPEDEECVPQLIQSLKDTSPVVRWAAAEGLGYIGPGAKAAVPALTVAMYQHISNTGSGRVPFDVRLEAAHAVWQIDHETEAPAKICREALQSGDSATRGWAFIYLNAMQPGDPSLLPQMMERLRGNGVFQLVAASQIGRFGPAAKEAVPDLIKLADSKNWDLRSRARRSLEQIDPEAARKLDVK